MFEKGRCNLCKIKRLSQEIVSSSGNTRLNVGETNKEVMAQTVCNPKTRILQKVTVDDVELMIESFEKWLDKKVDDRKEYIESNLCNYLVDTPVEDITDSKSIDKIIQDNMMEYSADVIFDRAISSVESGLKPSQVRSLWAMYTNKYFKLTKSLNVTGAVTKYHPHGSVYPTIVKMSQEDRHQLPLIIGEGNFGQYTSKNLMEASDRYTNVKLSPLAIESLKEIDKRYVDMIPTYDGKAQMPLYIPSKYPLVLTQASEGMAVGMASKMPSFNFNEVCNAIVKYVETGEREMLIPDFATGGFVKNNADIINSINTKGKGTVRLRAKISKDETSKVLTVTEMPYGVYREDVINSIIELVKTGKVKEVISVKDSTGLHGIGIRIACKKNTNLDELIEKLYVATPLESAYACNMNVLTKGMPKVLGVWGIVDKWIEFRKECIVNGMSHEKNKYEKELHSLKGFDKIINRIEDTISIIRFSDDIVDELMSQLGLDVIQAEYISNLQLKNINEKKISEKLKDMNVISDNIKHLDMIMSSSEELLKIIVNDLKDISSRYVVDRKTEIIEDVKVSKKKEILIEDYNVHISVTNEGYLKKVRLTSLKSNSIHRIKDGDFVKEQRNTENRADLLVFTSKQVCYKLKVSDIDDHKTTSLGMYLPSQLQLEEDEYVVDVVPTVDYSEDMIVAFDSGRVVRLSLKAYYTKKNRQKLMNALHVDKVVKMVILDGDANYVLKSANNRALIFNTKNLQTKVSKNSQGIVVMKHRDIEVVSMGHIDEVDIATLGRYVVGKNGTGAGVGILLGDKI